MFLCFFHAQVSTKTGIPHNKQWRLIRKDDKKAAETKLNHPFLSKYLTLKMIYFAKWNIILDETSLDSWKWKVGVEGQLISEHKVEKI